MQQFMFYRVNRRKKLTDDENNTAIAIMSSK